MKFTRGGERTVKKKRKLMGWEDSGVMLQDVWILVHWEQRAGAGRGGVEDMKTLGRRCGG